MELMLFTCIVGIFIVRSEGQGQGQVTDWTCVSPVKEVYRKENTDALFKFDVSNQLPQQAGEFQTFQVAFYNGTLLGIVLFQFPTGNIISPAAGVSITADNTGKINVTLANVKLDNRGTYRVSGSSGTVGCSCLYILGIPTKPVISVTGNPAVRGSAILLCTSTSKTTPSNHSLYFVYSWKVDNTNNPTGPRYSYSSNKNTLTLSNIVREDANKQFTCSATEDVSDGYTSSSSDSLALNVRYPPDGPPVIIGYSNGDEYRVREGTKGQLSCSVSGGNPVPTLSWDCINNGTHQTTNSGTVTVVHTWLAARGQDRTCICRYSHYSGQRSVSIRIKILYTRVQSLYIEGHKGEKNVTLEEHTSLVQFKCVVDSNTETDIKIMFKGGVLVKQTNETSLSYLLRDVACTDSGVYTCEASDAYHYTNNSDVTLLVMCSPRPVRQMERNITSDLYNTATLSFSTIAYPYPGPKGFSWYKQTGERWSPLLSNVDLKISSSDLQSNLTLFNVTEEDFRQYKVIVRNEFGSYEQYLFLSERKGVQLTKEVNCTQNSDKTSLIVGITLGTVCCALVICLTYFIISKAHLLRKGSNSAGGLAKQTTYVNSAFAQEATEGQLYEQAGGDSTARHYADLCRYEHSDNDTYDVIKKS